MRGVGRPTIVIIIIVVLAVGAASVLYLPQVLNPKSSSTNVPKLVVRGVQCYLLTEIQTLLTCQILLSNSGSQSVGIQSCSIQLGGVAHAGYMQDARHVGSNNLTSIQGNTASLKVYCFVPAPSGTTSGGSSGSTATGSIVTNSTTISFSGTWV